MNRHNGRHMLFYISKILILLPYVIAAFFPCTAIASQRLKPPGQIIYPELQFKLPKAERSVLDNGVIIYHLEDNELPLVTVNLLIRSGMVYDPPGKEGTAEITAYLLKTGGTRKLSSAEIDERFDFIAASPSISVALDYIQINFSFMDKDIDESLELLSQILLEPAFEQQKIELSIKLKTEDIRRLKDDPQKLAFREFNRLIYSANPHGRYVTLQSLKRIAREDLVKFHNTHFQPQNIMMAMTGNISGNIAVNKIKKYFGNLRQSANPASYSVPNIIEGHESGIFCIKKQIPQSTVISGYFSPGRTDSDFHAFTIFDFIVGSGGFPSRIFSAVRNNEGLAYSAGSIYRPRYDHGIFAAYAFTKTGSTYKTLSLIKSELEKVQNGNINESEIEWAKKSIINGFIFSFTSPEQIAWQQMKMEYDGLPDDFLDKYREKIKKVQLADLNRITQKYFKGKEALTVILGNVEMFDRQESSKQQIRIITPEE